MLEKIGIVVIVIIMSLNAEHLVVEPTPDETITTSSDNDQTQDLPKPQRFFFTSTNTWMETAALGVAKLVSSSFNTKPSLIYRQSTPDLMGNILRILGLDTSKLVAVAVNALIFLAQIIGSTLSKSDKESNINNESPPPGSPVNWLFNKSPPKALQLVRAAQEKALPDQLIELLRDGARSETDCVQLLICKSAPIIWSMQNALTTTPSQKLWKSISPLERMFLYLPPLKNILENAIICNSRFPSCRLRYSLG